jgi:hypothetical protein
MLDLHAATCIEGHSPYIRNLEGDRFLSICVPFSLHLCVNWDNGQGSVPSVGRWVPRTPRSILHLFCSGGKAVEGYLNPLAAREQRRSKGADSLL